MAFVMMRRTHDPKTAARPACGKAGGAVARSRESNVEALHALSG
jgi:hypothetical protein